jgi:chromosome partitioning protein
MIVTVASFKGGVGKTTTAVHLAAYFQRRAPTLLLDGDPNRSALLWATGGGLPFTVADVDDRAHRAGELAHTVIDTQARPEADDLRVLVERCDLLIIPTTPDTLAVHGLMHTISALRELSAERWRVLLSIVPSRPSRDGAEARAALQARKLPVFKGEVRRRVAFQKAVSDGVPVYAVKDARAREAWADYEGIGREVLRGQA